MQMNPYSSTTELPILLAKITMVQSTGANNNNNNINNQSLLLTFTQIPADSNGIQKTNCINDLNIMALTPMSFFKRENGAKGM